MAKKKKKKQSDPKFSKGQLIGSNRFKFKKDMLNVLLDSGKTYTIKEVDNLIKEYNEREV